MEAVLRTTTEVIAALGGTNKAARKLGKTPRAVSQWKKRQRIPSELFLSIDSALKAEGLPKAAPDVFGMAVPTEVAGEASNSN